jgi:hypothetical protein
MNVLGVIDPTITIGNLIEITCILGGGALTIVRLNNSVVKLSIDMQEVQAEVKKIADLMTAVAVQSVRIDSISERINTIDRRYDELRKNAKSS